MYDELIKRLRECTAEMNGEKTLWHQAADAIEELLASCNNYEAALKDSVEEYEKLQQYADLYEDLTEKSQKVATELKQQLQKSEEDNVNLTGWLAEEHAKHLWIPVTERLPEEDGRYLYKFCDFDCSECENSIKRSDMIEAYLTAIFELKQLIESEDE